MKRNSRRKKQSFKGSLLILLLLLAFIIMATYAWFTANRTVRISSLDVNISTSQGFQISTDGFNWKTVINSTDITNPPQFASHKNHLPTVMDPYSTATNRITAGTNIGYMKMFKGEVTTDNDGEYVITTDNALGDEGPSTGGYIAFDLFFKTNNTIDLFLAEDAGVFDIATIASRQNKGMENAARVGFVYQGYYPAASITTSTPATTYQALTENDPNGNLVTIWEPNFDAHTPSAVTDIYNIFGPAIASGVTSPISLSRQVYDGISAPILKPTEIGYVSPVYLKENTNATGTSTIPATLGSTYNNSAYFTPISGSKFVPTEKTTLLPYAPFSAPVRLGTVTLLPGVTKFRIYMWLEGQDWDCYDSASGSDIRWDLILSADLPPLPDPDIALVAAAKAIIGGNVNITMATAAGETAEEAAATIAAQALVTNGVTVVVTWDGTPGDFTATFTKGSQTDTSAVTITRI